MRPIDLPANGNLPPAMTPFFWPLASFLIWTEFGLQSWRFASAVQEAALASLLGRQPDSPSSPLVACVVADFRDAELAVRQAQLDAFRALGRSV